MPTEAVGGYVRKITDAQGASPAVKQQCARKLSAVSPLSHGRVNPA
ncbi:MAG: hypothetical protein HXO54_06540 [Rothia dentocariosa]|nr:hypothetical protein [Rothia dentocariosa]